MSGLESQLNQTNERIASIRSRLGVRGAGRPAASTAAIQPAPAKTKLSADARKRIGEATRKRWEAFRAGKTEAEKPKRKMSAEGRARIIAATKKRWAAVYKAQRAAATKNATPKKARKAAKKVAAVAATPATT